jgi:hypothetical protein
MRWLACSVTVMLLVGDPIGADLRKVGGSQP